MRFPPGVPDGKRVLPTRCVRPLKAGRIRDHLPTGPAPKPQFGSARRVPYRCTAMPAKAGAVRVAASFGPVPVSR
ncbi:hypothetical protein EDD30_3805 [Couchioplanes caeruleus]|uniref:Uncharacterized protein n=1 Tax=Couchioplanes caeruleus TaxID=56438 RepID=A0A3N1GKX4_9ACTN|nr:hypothetical protein EDD30_3805 [Couchioplanes caeruleus]